MSHGYIQQLPAVTPTQGVEASLHQRLAAVDRCRAQHIMHGRLDGHPVKSGVSTSTMCLFLVVEQCVLHVTMALAGSSCAVICSLC